MHYTVCSVQYALYSVQCAVCEGLEEAPDGCGVELGRHDVSDVEGTGGTELSWTSNHYVFHCAVK